MKASQKKKKRTYDYPEVTLGSVLGRMGRIRLQSKRLNITLTEKQKKELAELEKQYKELLQAQKKRLGH